MNLAICMLMVAAAFLMTATAAPQQRERNEKQFPMDDLPANGATIEEVIVESALHIKPKVRQPVRRVRDVFSQIYAAHKRIKRQPRRHAGGNAQVGSAAGAGGIQAGVNVGAGPSGGLADANVHFGATRPLGPNGYNQEQAASNGAAHNIYNNGLESGSSAANAQAQGFQSQGANGSFGASSVSTATQSQNFSPFGSNNAAGAAHSLMFHLPNGQTINFSSTNSIANGPYGNNANSHGGAVSISR